MITMILKYLWAQRKSNTLLFVELMFAGIFLFFILDTAISAYRTYRIPEGFNVERCYVLSFSIPNDDSIKAVEANSKISDFLKGRAEVEGMAVTFISEPYSGCNVNTHCIVNGKDIQVRLMAGDASFSSVLGIPIIAGRWFTGAEVLQNSKVCLVNESLCDVLKIPKKAGTEIGLAGDSIEKRKVIGIIPDVKTGSFEKVEPIVFSPLELNQMRYGWKIVVKLRKGMEKNFAATLKILHDDMAPSLGFRIRAVENFEDKKAIIDLSKSNMLSGMMWCTIFFLVNVFLGIYVVFSGRVKKRFQEIGIRMAIGASRKDIVRMVTGESLLLLVLSFIPVLLIAINLAYLDKLEPTYAVTAWRVAGEFCLTFIILALAVLASVLIPALKASKVNPAVVLHYE